MTHQIGPQCTAVLLFCNRANLWFGLDCSLTMHDEVSLPRGNTSSPKQHHHIVIFIINYNTTAVVGGYLKYRERCTLVLKLSLNFNIDPDFSSNPANWPSIKTT